MPVEIRGQQLRIRVKSPSLFKHSSFRTQTLSRGMQRVAGKLRKDDKWVTQSWRFNLDKYLFQYHITDELYKMRARGTINDEKYSEACILVDKWWRKHKKK